MPLLNKFLFELLVILNNAVVRHPDIPLAISVRMAVLFGYTSVCRPAGIEKGGRSLYIYAFYPFLKILNLSYCFYAKYLLLPGIVRGHARRIISAVLESL